MRKLIVLVTLGLLLISVNNAFAALPTEAEEKEDKVWTVPSSGSTTFQNEFAWIGSQPWVYIEKNNIAQYGVRSLWTVPDGTSSYWSDLLYKTDNNHAWLSINNWDSIKQRGFEWNVNVDKLNNGGNWATMGSAKFVTPEPLSASLFLLGAGALIARRVSRKKLRKA